VELPYAVGALYNRKEEIHGLFGGQRQGGISTPKEHPLVIAFTGEAGAAHGYTDFWDDDEILHYFGEGQTGHMRYRGGNLAIEDHIKNGKRLVLFQMMGKGRPYRFLGEFVALSSYIRPNTPDTTGAMRDAIVFRLKSMAEWPQLGSDLGSAPEAADHTPPSETARRMLVDIRTKQRLFRERLVNVEKGCRLTGVEDLRFLRASHMKPWSLSDSSERTDGENGLLLTPSADLLFDKGWISFDRSGKVLYSNHLPPGMTSALGIAHDRPRYPGFSKKQGTYLEFHRDVIFRP